jgi:hypothetical protein
MHQPKIKTAINTSSLTEVTVHKFSNEWQKILKMIEEATWVSEMIMNERERCEQGLFIWKLLEKLFPL